MMKFLIPCAIVVTSISNLFQKTITSKAIRVNYFLALFFGTIYGLAFADVRRLILTPDQSFCFVYVQLLPAVFLSLAMEMALLRLPWNKKIAEIVDVTKSIV